MEPNYFISNIKRLGITEDEARFFGDLRLFLQNDSKFILSETFGLCSRARQCIEGYQTHCDRSPLFAFDPDLFGYGQKMFSEVVPKKMGRKRKRDTERRVPLKHRYPLIDDEYDFVGLYSIPSPTNFGSIDLSQFDLETKLFPDLMPYCFDVYEPLFESTIAIYRKKIRLASVVYFGKNLVTLWQRAQEGDIGAAAAIARIERHVFKFNDLPGSRVFAKLAKKPMRPGMANKWQIKIDQAPRLGGAWKRILVIAYCWNSRFIHLKLNELLAVLVGLDVADKNLNCDTLKRFLYRYGFKKSPHRIPPRGKKRAITSS